MTQLNPAITIPVFIGTLFQFRDRIHLAHLSTTSYASHGALNELYEGLLDQIDALAESAQAEGLLKITIPQSDPSDESVAQELLDFVRTNRYIFPYSYQNQIIDNIEELGCKTVYKVRFLK
ncbi:MAG: hypothetical protein KBB16_02660 [Candidatus Pacebacteria bacterium]|nr:hypothetical protein [Candidatus Paceibacterota bacterium]